MTRAMRVLLLLAMASLGPSAAGAVECVGAFGCSATIQDAVDAADPGEFIVILPGTYPDPVRVPADKDGVWLYGLAPSLVVLEVSMEPGDPLRRAITIESGATGVRISNLTVRNGDNEGILGEIGSHSAHIQNVVVEGPKGSCINLLGDDATVRDSTLRSCGRHGIEIGFRGTTGPFFPCPAPPCLADRAQILNNSIQGCGTAGVQVIGTDALMQGNDVSRTQGVGLRYRGGGTTLRGNTVRTTREDSVQGRGDGVLIEGNAFSNADEECMELRGRDIQILNNTFHFCEEKAFAIQGGSGPFHSEPQDNRIVGNEGRFLGHDCMEAGGPNLLVQDNVFDHCSDDGLQIFGSADGARILDNTLRNIRFDAIEIGSDAENVLVEGNLLEYVRLDGIDHNGDDGTIQDNTVRHVQGVGIKARGRNPTVRGNLVENGIRAGYRISCGAFSLANGLSIDDSVNAGDCNGGFVENNVARHISDDDGFQVFFGNAAAADPPLVLLDNRAEQTGDDGFQLFGSDIIAANNVATGNGGGRRGTGDNGFLVFGANHILQGNEASENFEDGFHLCGQGHLLFGNTARDNLEDGFDVNGDQRGAGENCDSTASDDCTVEDSATCENAATGIILANNSATGSVAVGIELSAGATGLAIVGNVAAGNEVDFCDETPGAIDAGGNVFANTSGCVRD